MDKHCSSGKSPFVWKSLDILPRCSWTRCCCLLWYALAMQIRASCHRALSCLVVRNCRWGGERRNLALSIWNTIKNIMWGTFSGWLHTHTHTQKKISSYSRADMLLCQFRMKRSTRLHLLFRLLAAGLYRPKLHVQRVKWPRGEKTSVKKLLFALWHAWTPHNSCENKDSLWKHQAVPLNL